MKRQRRQEGQSSCLTKGWGRSNSVAKEVEVDWLLLVVPEGGGEQDGGTLPGQIGDWTPL